MRGASPRSSPGHATPDFSPWLLAPSSGGSMPPIQQQQTSRAGLITALVVSIVFAVGFLIWAFMSNADVTNLTTENQTRKTKYGKVIGEGALGNITELQGQMSPDPDKPRTGTLL